VSDLFIPEYPRVGSVWKVDLGPDQEMKRISMRVIYSGHGSVVVKQFGGKYTVSISIERWMNGPFQPELVEKEGSDG